MPTPTPSPPDALETLRQVNEYLRSALLRLCPERTHCSSLQPQDFFGLLTQLLQASKCLCRPQHPEIIASAKSAALEKEALEYRGNLEKLKYFLPDLQVRLLAEKSRLETAMTHVAAKAAWAKSNQQTL
jgi:superfamily I DNA and/or RNA helicase